MRKQNKRMTKAQFRKARKQDALALAELVYDIFKEENRGGKIKAGQSNANQTSSN